MKIKLKVFRGTLRNRLWVYLILPKDTSETTVDLGIAIEDTNMYKRFTRTTLKTLIERSLDED